MKEKYRYIMLIVSLTLASTLISGHKEAAESVQISANGKFSFGIMPAHPTVQQQQTFYIKVQDKVDGSPVAGLTINVAIYRRYVSDQTRLLLQRSTALEKNPGDYLIAYTFAEKGNYDIIAQANKGNTQLVTLEKNIQVEPNGPSLLFWMFMLLALIAAVYLATISDRM